MVKGRSPCCNKGMVRKGAWTPSEDLRLIAHINRHGHPNWRALPRQAGLLRCGKSCRLRWTNYLSPNIKRGNFTRDEEDTIIRLHQSFGNQWSRIASYLPQRTDNEIKNFFNTHLKRRLGLAPAPARRGVKPGAKKAKSKKSSSGISSSASSSSTLASSSGKGNGFQAGLQPRDEGSIISSSSSSMTSSGHGDQACLSAEDIQLLLDMEDSFVVTQVNEPESVANYVVPYAPMEYGFDVWDNIGVPPPVESNNVQSNEVGPETWKRLKDLERELVLDEPAEDATYESLLDRFLTEVELEMDPGMGY